MKTIVITGSSSGIGKATAEYFAGKGWKVAATMRNPESEVELKELENISVYAMDVTNESSVTRATEQILSDYDKVDVVLNNAGYGLVGAFEAATPEQIKHQYDTNVFGLMTVTRAFIPHFRTNKAGLFLNVSSIGGLVTFPLSSLYSSTKWAVEGFSESLSFELGEFGIQVKIIEPGGVNTEFNGRSMVFAFEDGLTAYDGLLTRFQKNNARSGGNRSNAGQIAEAIYKAATDGKTQLRYLVGVDAVQSYEMRQKIGDDLFISQTKQQLLS